MEARVKPVRCKETLRPLNAPHLNTRIEANTRNSVKMVAQLVEKFPAFSATRPSLWSSGHSSWLQIQRSRCRFLALPDFLRSSESGTKRTQLSIIEELLDWKSNDSGSRKSISTAVGIRCADSATSSIRKS
jgi:hypothetical protein